jgi:ferredoxin-NADP reductase
MISGGIGITPLQSVFKQLIIDQKNGRNLRKVQNIIFLEHSFEP